APAPKPPEAAPAPKPAEPASLRAALAAVAGTGNSGMPPTPSARRILEEKGIPEADVQGSGRRGQGLKPDALAASAPAPSASPAAAPQGGQPAAARSAMTTVPVPVTQMRAPSAPNDAAREERVHMTRLRQTIARRLKDAQNTAAMLTTFNDVD